MSLSACDIIRKVHLQFVSPADLLGRNSRLEPCSLNWHLDVGAWDKACVYTAGIGCVRNEQTHILMADRQRHGGRVGQRIRVPSRLELNQMCVGGWGFPSSLDRMKLVLRQPAGAVRLQGGCS